MARYLFDGGEVAINADGTIADNHAFTVWTERAGGTNVTADMKAPDGTSDATCATDSDGEVPYLRGPDGTRILYRDLGSDTRTPWYSAEAVGQALSALPPGGSDGQALTKASATDYATEWETPNAALTGTVSSLEARVTTLEAGGGDDGAGVVIVTEAEYAALVASSSIVPTIVYVVIP